MTFTLPAEVTRQILSEADKVLKTTDIGDERKLGQLWHTMLFLRSRVISTLLRNTIGMKTYAGPFAGMELTDGILQKVFGPIISGSYEHELHPAIERIIQTPYRNIINIGCGWGFYVVGLARRMQDTKFHGYDIDSNELDLCRGMMALNKVDDRITLHGAFKGEDFARYVAEGKTLAIVDIEGGEYDLLDPVRFPALKQIDMIVEMHDVLIPGLSHSIPDRFKDSHTVETVRNKIELFDFTPIVGTNYIDPLDRFVLNWENRDGATPWAVMWSKA